MNIELLTSVKHAILTEPASFYMEDWFSLSELAPCGTAACIAGHGFKIQFCEPGATMAEARHQYQDEEGDMSGRVIDYVMADAFDINQAQMSKLCHLRHWPEQFRDRYLFSKTPEERADVAADRINHFIKTGGE
jgi:hypothetical protein